MLPSSCLPHLHLRSASPSTPPPSLLLELSREGGGYVILELKGFQPLAFKMQTMNHSLGDLVTGLEGGGRAFQGNR